jgi:ABC-type Zn uptake system ZnuABC Zn-binding protein ZnuA
MTLVPPSANPHLFELSPVQLREAEHAAAAVFIGAGMEPWSGRLISASGISPGRVVELAGDIPLLEGDDGHGHGHAAGNPHVWLDPVLAVDCVRRISSLLAQVLPDSTRSIEQRAASYIDSLRSLDASIRASVATWTSRAFIADHGTWSYFARRYGLDEVARIERIPGRDASASELRSMLGLVGERHVAAVWADERSNNRASASIAKESGLPLVLLRPTFAPDGYIAMMRHNLRAMEEVMR